MKNRMKKTIRLAFKTDSGKKAYITVPGPSVPPDEAIVRQAMQAIVAAGIVRMAAGALTAPLAAKHIALDATEYDMRTV